MGRKRISNQELINIYKKTKSVWKTAEEVGLCGQSVHERLVRIGEINKMRVFSESDKKNLISQYKKYRDSGKLNELAIKLGRTKQYICRMAKNYGLTDPAHHKPYAEKLKNPYFKFHARIRKLKGSPKKCEVCGEDGLKKWYDWANITGDYDNPEDYKRMCRKCHRKHDKDRPMLRHK